MASSSSSLCCERPFCIGSGCTHFSDWILLGVNDDNSNNCILYVSFEVFAEPGSSSSSSFGSLSSDDFGFQQVEIYSDYERTSLVAIGQIDLAGTIILEERNSSGIDGTVVWDGVLVGYPSFATLDCVPFSSSSSSSSSGSFGGSLVPGDTESSSSSSSESSSSSSNCCNYPQCVGTSCQYFSGWYFENMTDHNSTLCRLYVLLEYFDEGQQVRVYKDASYAYLVALGQGGIGTIVLEERNSSGLSGTVVWGGTPVDSPESLILDCEASSSSSTSLSSSSSLTSESTSSSSSSDTSESSSSSSQSSLSSSSQSSSSSSSSSIDSSSTSSESVLNTSSSSSSSAEVWNKIKPTILGMATVNSVTIKNRLAQTIIIGTDAFSIGKVFCYFYGLYGTSAALTIHLDIYNCNDDGSPSSIIDSETLAGSEITKDGWYEFEFNISGSTPSNEYMSFVVWQEGGDENNYVLWGYESKTDPDSGKAWYSSNNVVWTQQDNVVRSIRAISAFDAFDLVEHRINTPAASLASVSQTALQGEPVFIDTEVRSTDNKVVIDYPNFMVSFVVDTSGSMGWNDRYGTREGFLQEFIDRIKQTYSTDAQILFDIVRFGGIQLNVELVLAGLGSPATINLDAASPSRTTYVFSVDTSTASKGDIYTHNGSNYTVFSDIADDTTLLCTGVVNPLASGVLTRASGSGSATIDFSSFDEAKFDDGILAYGFRNLSTHEYNVGKIGIDSSSLDGTVDITNWRAFGSDSVFVLGNNGPDDDASVDFNVLDTNFVARKTFGDTELVTTKLLADVAIGDETISVEDVSFVATDVLIDLVDGNNISTSHTITAVSEEDSTIDISPSAKFAINGWATGRGIAQSNFLAKNPTGNTIKLLVRDIKANASDINTFFVQTVDGYNIEWDFTPFREWILYNIYYMDETAVLPLSLFDQDGDPVPDGSKVFFYVDGLPGDAVGGDQVPVRFLTRDAEISQTRIYLNSVSGYSRDQEFRVYNTEVNVSASLITEDITISSVGEDSLGDYIDVVEPLQSSYFVDDASQVAERETDEESDKQINVANELSPSLIFVDVTPIFTGKDLSPSLLEPYDPPPVSKDASYADLNLDRERAIFNNVVDVPTIDGKAAIRVLPVTEDNLKKISSKKQETNRLLRHDAPQTFVDQEEQDSGDVESLSETTTTTTTSLPEDADYTIKTPVLSISGLAEGSMTTFSHTLVETDLRNINVAGLTSGESSRILIKPYRVYPVLSIEDSNEHVVAQQILNDMEVLFTPPFNIYSQSANDYVSYTSSLGFDSERCYAFDGYIDKNAPGVNATSRSPLTIEYIVSDKGNLKQGGSLNIKIYSNRFVDLGQFVSQVGSVRPDSSDVIGVKGWMTDFQKSQVNVRFPAETQTVDGVQKTVQPLTDYDKWREAVNDNPVTPLIDVSKNATVKSKLNPDILSIATAFEGLPDPLNGFRDVTYSTSFENATSYSPDSPISYSECMNTYRSGWTLATQFDSTVYEQTIPISSDGKSTLVVPASEGMDFTALLMVTASISFGNSSQFEVIASDLIVVADPIDVGRIEPSDIDPKGEDVKYALATTVSWRDNPIDPNTVVHFSSATEAFSNQDESNCEAIPGPVADVGNTNIEPSVGYVIDDEGWASGPYIGPHVVLTSPYNFNALCTCYPRRFEPIEVSVSLGPYTRTVVRMLQWNVICSADDPEEGEIDFRFIVEETSPSAEYVFPPNEFGGRYLWADGAELLYTANLNWTQPSSFPFTTFDFDHLMGEEQPPLAPEYDQICNDKGVCSGAPAKIVASSTQSLKLEDPSLRWSRDGEVFISGRGLNQNIGNSNVGPFVEGQDCPFTSSYIYPDLGRHVVSISTSYQYFDADSQKTLLRSGAGYLGPDTELPDGSICQQRVMANFREPLAISTYIEEKNGIFNRNGVATATIVADVTWKGELITEQFTGNNGVTVNQKLPDVYFLIGVQSAANKWRNPVTLDYNIMDSRGGMDDALGITQNNEMSLSTYTVPLQPIRTDIYANASTGYRHVHVTEVDSDGDGLTTSVIVLEGDVPDHVHIIENYAAAASGVTSHTHSVRSVAVTEIAPMANWEPDVAVNAYVKYDPTGCDIFENEVTIISEESFLEVTVNLNKYNPWVNIDEPPGNRMMFSSVILLGLTTKWFDVAVGAGYAADGDLRSMVDHHDCLKENGESGACTNPRNAGVFTALTPVDTEYGFDLAALARFPEHEIVDSAGNVIVVPEVPVPDGTRVTFEVKIYDWPDAAEGNVLVVSENTLRRYMLIHVVARSSSGGFEAQGDRIVEMSSTLNWLPSVKKLLPDFTSDSIYLTDAFSQIEAFGASQIHDGVKLAAERIVDYQTQNPQWKNAEKQIYLLTDGDENTSENSLENAISNVTFIGGTCVVPVNPVRLGFSYSSDSVLLKRYALETCGSVFDMIHATALEIVDVVDTIVTSPDFDSVNFGTYSNTVDLGSSNLPSSMSLNGVVVPTGGVMRYRIRSSSDKITWSPWSPFVDGADPQSFSSDASGVARYLQYEVSMFGNEDFVSPEVSGTTLDYYKAQNFTTFFEPVDVSLGGDDYVSSIHISHQAFIPSTSEVIYGYAPFDTTDPQDYYGVTRPMITPDRHTILLGRFNEMFKTTDFETYFAMNGRWNSSLRMEVRRINVANPNGVLVSSSDYSVNHNEGSITFFNTQDANDTITLSLYFQPLFRVLCSVTNFGTETASIDNICILYNTTKRIPRASDGSIIYSPISKRIS